MEARLSTAIAQPRFYAVFVGSFAALALLLDAFGIYGLRSYTVAQRRGEIGIRMGVEVHGPARLRVDAANGDVDVRAGRVGVGGAGGADRVVAVVEADALSKGWHYNVTGIAMQRAALSGDTVSMSTLQCNPPKQPSRREK